MHCKFNADNDAFVYCGRDNGVVFMQNERLYQIQIPLCIDPEKSGIIDHKVTPHLFETLSIPWFEENVKLKLCYLPDRNKIFALNTNLQGYYKQTGYKFLGDIGGIFDCDCMRWDNIYCQNGVEILHNQCKINLCKRKFELCYDGEVVIYIVVVAPE